MKTSLSSSAFDSDLMHEVRCNNCNGVWYCTCGSMKHHETCRDHDIHRCGMCPRDPDDHWTSPNPLCAVCYEMHCGKHDPRKPNMPVFKSQPAADPEAWEETRQFLMDLVDVRR